MPSSKNFGIALFCAQSLIPLPRCCTVMFTNKALELLKALESTPVLFHAYESPN